MRLLVVNPNTSREMTAAIHRAAEEFSFIKPETALAASDDD